MHDIYTRARCSLIETVTITQPINMLAFFTRYIPVYYLCKNVCMYIGRFIATTVMGARPCDCKAVSRVCAVIEHPQHDASIATAIVKVSYSVFITSPPFAAAVDVIPPRGHARTTDKNSVIIIGGVIVIDRSLQAWRW